MAWEWQISPRTARPSRRHHSREQTRAETLHPLSSRTCPLCQAQTYYLSPRLVVLEHRNSAFSSESSSPKSAQRSTSSAHASASSLTVTSHPFLSLFSPSSAYLASSSSSSSSPNPTTSFSLSGGAHHHPHRCHSISIHRRLANELRCVPSPGHISAPSPFLPTRACTGVS